MHTLFLLLALATALNATDLKITTITRTDSGTMLGVDENARTTYVHGPMRREEFRGFVGEGPSRRDSQPPRMAVINNCDTHESFTVDLDAQEYREGTLRTYPTEEEMRRRVADAKARKPANPPPPNLVIESNTVDTGETAAMFGYTAHHVITTVKETPTGNLGARMSTREETIDAWYIDLQVPMDCLPAYLGGSWGSLSILTAGGLDVHPSTTHTGPVPKGYPVKMKRTSYDRLNTPDGKQIETVSSSESEVTELSEELLDPALFQVPAGFKKVEHLYRH